MQLAFATKKLRDVCEHEREANRAYGESAARKLRARLSDLHVAANAAELVAGSPRETESGHLEVRLGERFSLMLTANHKATPTLKNGRVDWARVTRVKILKIEDADA